MIQKESQVKVADNTGIKMVNIIQVLGRKKGHSYQQFGSVGDIVSCSVRKVAPNGAFTKGDVIHGVVIRVKKEVGRKDGSFIRFDENAIAVINKETKEPKGTRIFGPIARELKDKGFNKVISLAPEVL